MPFFFAPIAAFFASVFGKFLVDATIKWIAIKALVFLALTVTFPIVIKNLINWLFTILSDIAISSVSSHDLEPLVLNMTGLAGYLSNCLMLSDCIAVLMTACIIRFTLNFIPFIG